MKRAILIFGILGGILFLFMQVLGGLIYYVAGYLAPVAIILPSYLSIKYISKKLPSATFEYYFLTGFGAYIFSYCINFLFLRITNGAHMFDNKKLLGYLMLLGVGIITNLVIVGIFRSRYKDSQFKNRRW